MVVILSLLGCVNPLIKSARSELNNLEDISQGQKSLCVTHPLMLVTMCAKYGKNWSRTVCAVEWTRQDALYFWRDFSGVKHTCWTTGSWQSCLSPEVVSSIPAGSTIIYRFLCGFICVSLCQSIKIKPTNMYIASARAQFKINTHRCWNWHLCIPDGLSVVQCSLGHVIGVAFFGAISVAWSVRAGQLAAGGVASVRRSWVRSPPGPR